MRAWWELYKKELYSIGFFIMVTFILVFVWEFFLFYKMNSWPLGVSFGLSFLPFTFFPFLVLWLGYNSYRQEWKDNTNYFLLSIPRRGWEISLAKMVSSMTFYLGITLFAFLLIFLFHQNFIASQIASEIPEGALSNGLAVNLMLKMVLVYWLYGMFIYIIIQFSQLISLFFNRFRGLITIIVFTLSNYIVFRGASILAPLFRWVPDFSIRSFTDIGMRVSKSNTIYIGSGPIISSLLVLAGLFILGSWIIEKQLDV